ncbi:MAG: hypothetical protein HY895_20655 [Deltaproteobacteria bacterium]|nr:hypothetical protein [Deltaproteobacteria bacterium]
MYGGCFADSRAAAFSKGVGKNVSYDCELYKQAGDNISMEEADALKGRENLETASGMTQYYLIHDFNYFDL